VATNWGQRHHPAWSANLIAEPRAELQIGRDKRPCRARLAGDDEKTQIWPRFVAMWPAYDDYLERSGREVRLFFLDPA
jgi:deazaflavin-dependent oxidoreductase (nitroreductase family)